MSCEEELKKHVLLAGRREQSVKQLERVQKSFSACKYFRGLPITIFCAGSLARMEIGTKSDLDLFVTAEKASKLQGRLVEYTLFANLIQLNEDLGFLPFSNDGEYLKIYFIDDMERHTGSRHDDSENLFTARMLFMLESNPLLHLEIYEQHLTKIVKHYYRDQIGKYSFRPLFLLNDILRYWRTLCLNYEERRHEPDRPWRKKNVNLKFSRMLTVFSTILPLIVKPITSPVQFKDLCRKTPLERLALGIDLLQDDTLISEWTNVLDIYEAFLGWKEDEDVEKYLQGGAQKSTVQDYAEQFSTFLHRALSHRSISMEYRRYLVL